MILPILGQPRCAPPWWVFSLCSWIYQAKKRVSNWLNRFAGRFRWFTAFLLQSRSCTISGVLALAGMWPKSASTHFLATSLGKKKNNKNKSTLLQKHFLSTGAFFGRGGSMPYEPSHLWRCIFRGDSKSSYLYKFIFRSGCCFQLSLKIGGYTHRLWRSFVEVWSRLYKWSSVYVAAHFFFLGKFTITRGGRKECLGLSPKNYKSKGGRFWFWFLWWRRL